MAATLEAARQASERLQELVPDTILVGRPAAAFHAGHRASLDDDHVLADLRERFDDVLRALDDTQGWVTARVERPVLILGNLDGVETGIRNLVRLRQLEFEEVRLGGLTLRVPTLAEIARIKTWLIAMRNATRDYVGFAAVADRLGDEEAARVVLALDDYYADQVGPGGRRVATQVARQLAEPLPGDLSDVDLRSYRGLVSRWHDWGAVSGACLRVALRVLDLLAEDAQ